IIAAQVFATMSGLAIAPELPAQTEGSSAVRAAGCYIATPHGVVVSINRLLNKIQMPMGRHKKGETAAQTAARETFEETGIAVEVGAPILHLESRQIVLFACTPLSPVANYSALSAPDTVEVSEVLVLDPHTMQNVDGRVVDTPWRFPNTRLLLRMLYVGAAAP
ncbi:MAG: NUDIX domain-containing protein, partial [Gammaproteobacteria bacterium]|nr:NUDIX domain-containing protein [Gammaproteobacteria bacterium]